MSEVANIRQMLVNEFNTLRRQAERIQAAIDALDRVDQGAKPEPKAAPKKAAKKPVAKAPKATSAKPKAKAAAKKNGKETPLPTTPSDWFLELITKTPQSSAEIYDAAVRKIGGELSKAARGKLRGRLSFNLADLKRQEKIAPIDGPGRHKLYVRT